MNKKILAVIALICSFLGVNMVFADVWTQKTDFGGSARIGASGFSIGNKGYIGTGWPTLKDFWEYDSVEDTWSQKADFAGSGRYSATGFSIGSKGYIGMGYASGYAQDFWEYDPVENKWAQRANFGGGRREAPTGFSIGNKGYVGAGYTPSTFVNDFWEYDPANDIWTQKAAFPGLGRWSASAFSIGTKGYMGMGCADRYGSAPFYKDFYEYDPANDTWTQKADFGGAARYGAVAFAIGSKGYAGAGLVNSTRLSDFWEYDPTVGPNGTWIQQTDVGGTAINVSFTIGNKGYVGLGTTGYLKGTKEFWEYEPTCYQSPVKVSSNYFDTVQTAYNSAASNSTIQIQDHLFTEDVSLNRDITTILDGGYICQYTTNNGYSTVDGSITISGGTVTVKNLIIK